MPADMVNYSCVTSRCIKKAKRCCGRGRKDSVKIKIAKGGLEVKANYYSLQCLNMKVSIINEVIDMLVVFTVN